MDTWTEREAIVCTVKEAADGLPFLMFEPAGGDPLPSLPNCQFGLYLNRGTTLEQASDLARMINARVGSFFALIADVPVR
jgi:hypothetical protein